MDSYGNVWQSDNDDDGNESCRINFIMYYGNYGFLDEMSKASWTTSRINLEEKIEQRHWHQNDPGVVPNVLITGAGSPAGMTFYEGSSLASCFSEYTHSRRGRIITSYALICQPEKALVTHWKSKISLKVKTSGFGLSMWLLAPDGSLFIADWYDPILGGGAAADASKGRIYRVAREANAYSMSRLQICQPLPERLRHLKIQILKHTISDFKS